MKNHLSVSRSLIYLFVGLIALLGLEPMVLIVISSFTDEISIAKYGYSLFPDKFSLEAYRILFSHGAVVGRSYAVSIFITLVGTALSVLITYCAGFALANRRFNHRNAFSLFFYITTIFTAGLVPQYMIVKSIGIYNTLWALIIPGCFSPFNMYLVKNYVESIPDSLMESAFIDGAGLLNIAFRIYYPICKPVLATITLFYSIGYWNSYFNALMFVDDSSLHPLQMFLFRLQSDIQMIKQMNLGSAMSNPPSESLKMATAVITIGPIILLYPLLQKYFVKGIIIGAVKG